MKLLFLTALLFSPALDSASQTQIETSVAQASIENTILFRSAEVSRLGERIQIIWESDVGPVTVYASQERDQLTGEITLGRGDSSGSIDVSLPEREGHGRWFVHLVPARGKTLVVAERTLHLATAPNFRDLGGYRTIDGRWVRMGMLFRSDQLNLLSDIDLDRISATGIRTVADLRTSYEREREPDRIPANAKHHVFDMAAAQDPAPFMAALARGESREAMLGVYRQFPSSAATAAALNGLLSTAIQIDTPILFHCTAGKDRTGWASAVLLSLLGVPRDTVIADYLASAKLLEAKNAAILANPQPPFTVEQLQPLLGVERAFIETSFQEVEKRYGSIEAYAKEALGLDAMAIEKLRSRYLVGTPTS